MTEQQFTPTGSEAHTPTQEEREDIAASLYVRRPSVDKPHKPTQVELQDIEDSLKGEDGSPSTVRRAADIALRNRNL